jgi:hypothetical protein
MDKYDSLRFNTPLELIRGETIKNRFFKFRLRPAGV